MVEEEILGKSWVKKSILTLSAIMFCKLFRKSFKVFFNLNNSSHKTFLEKQTGINGDFINSAIKIPKKITKMAYLEVCSIRTFQLLVYTGELK